MTSCIRRSLLSVILAALSRRLVKTFPKVVWQKMRGIEKITLPNVCQPTKFHKREKTRIISRREKSDLRLEKTWWIGAMSLEIKFIKYPEGLSARIWLGTFRICKKRKKHKMINDKMNFNFEFCPLITRAKKANLYFKNLSCMAEYWVGWYKEEEGFYELKGGSEMIQKNSFGIGKGLWCSSKEMWIKVVQLQQNKIDDNFTTLEYGNIMFSPSSTTVSREFGWCLTTSVYKKPMHTDQFLT